MEELARFAVVMKEFCVVDGISGTCHILEGGGRAGANRGRVITFYATKKGRVTKNLSRALGRAMSFFVNIAVHLK